MNNYIPLFNIDVAIYPCPNPAVCLQLFNWNHTTILSLADGVCSFGAEAIESSLVKAGIKVSFILPHDHYSDVTMSALAPQITGNSTVRLTVCLDEHQRNHQSPRY